MTDIINDMIQLAQQEPMVAIFLLVGAILGIVLLGIPVYYMLTFWISNSLVRFINLPNQKKLVVVVALAIIIVLLFNTL